MTDIRQTPEYAAYLKQIGWTVERINGINYFIKKFPVIGAVIKIQRPKQFDNSTIKQLTKKYRAFQLIFEPLPNQLTNQLTNQHFRLSRHPYLPPKTLQLDLTKSEKKLLAEMKKDARYGLRKSEGRKLLIANNKLPDFQAAWKKAVGLRRYVPPLSHLAALKKSFKDNSLFLLAEDKSGGAVFVLADKVAYYWQAFTNKEGRKNFVQYKIVWEGIKWARGRGAKVFDFEGIYDPRFPDAGWLGFTHFKKSFGGYEVEYPGTYVKSLLPF